MPTHERILPHAPRMARLCLLGAALPFAISVSIAISVISAIAQVPIDPPMLDPPSAQSPGPSPSTPERPTDEELLLKPKQIDPESSRAEVLSDLFERLRQAPDEESARTVVEAIQKIWLRSGSDTIDLLMSRVAESVQAENLDLALDILDSVIEMKPDYAEGWNQRATVFFLQRDFAQSLDDLQRVLALEPRHFKAINGLATIMQEFGDKKGALNAFREALELYPQSEDMRRVVEELAREVEGQGI